MSVPMPHSIMLPITTGNRRLGRRAPRLPRHPLAGHGRQPPRSARVEVNVVDPILRKGYRFKGRGEVLAEGHHHEEILARYRSDRGSDTSRVKAVVLIAVETAAPLISPAYDAAGVTEAEVAARWRAHHLALHPGDG